MRTNIPLKKRLRMRISDIACKANNLMPQYNKGFRVLLYHSITDRFVNEGEENTTYKELFAKQMKYLIENKYNVISCKKAVSYLAKKTRFPVKTISVAFDDGYRDNYINALPILRKYNIYATIFLTVNFLREYSGDAQYLNHAEIMDIRRCGLIDFGCHGLSHKILSLAGEKELDEEIISAKQKLEYLTGGKIDLFAYPFGHSKSYNKKVIEKVKSAGFIGAFTTIFGLNYFSKNNFLLSRNRISWLDELNEFKKHLNGAYDWCSLFERLRYKRYC